MTKYTTEVKKYGKCRKYVKNGINTVYLTGTPYEIGLAHGKLCKTEIKDTNKKFFDFYDRMKKDSQQHWLQLSKQLEKNIPEEYIEEMRGIADGADIKYDKILFINTLSTISMKKGCFAFAFKNPESQIITLRQDDEYKDTDFHLDM
ncbi:MAG: hypothetical protein ACK2TV_09760, partial [Anaerolineales bacterium]